MRRNQPSSATRVGIVVCIIGLLAAGDVRAVQAEHDVHLIATPFTKTVTLPNGGSLSVPMWGFALDADADGVLDAGEVPSTPGPRISVPAGVTTLRVHLTNLLPEATSIVMPGQPFAAQPVRRADGRIQSMSPETAAGGGTRTYEFANVQPGTFLYQSGTHQAVQVQMGLYGAMTKDVAAGEAYAARPYDSEVLLLYSEIDVALHRAVNDGTYGHPELGGPTSTIAYQPTLFLVNGESYANDVQQPPLNAGRAGEQTLIRLLNAGLRTHVPVIENGAYDVIAEDGNAYPNSRRQASLLLAAGKTHDVMWTPAAAGDFAIYDRALSLVAADHGTAGMLARLHVTPADATPPDVAAANDSYAGVEDTPLAIAPGGVLANDTAGTTATLVTTPAAGTVILSPDGGFVYTPAANFAGVDSFTYRAVSGTAQSSPAMVTIVIAPLADAPAALAQAIGVDERESVPAQLKGSDADGDPLGFYIASLPEHGTLSVVNPATSAMVALTSADLFTAPGTGTLIPSGVVIYAPAISPSYAGADHFDFVASDGSATSAAARVDVTVHAVAAAADPAGQALTLSVVGSDGTPVTAYRWTLEEDRTYDVIPGVADPNTLSVSFHVSYMPVVQSGDESSPPRVDATKRYFVSVLPKSTGYTNGGGQIARGQTAATVIVNKGPIPTAQVRVRVFRDSNPLNGMWDNEEPGLAGFEVTIEDAGGRYGMSAAHQLMDAFGNQLGTIYAPCSAEQCDSYEIAQMGNGFVLTDADGYAVIPNLSPGKYGVKVRPPGGQAWVQTTTIEGTPTIDAWVKANEPTYFAEFGPPGPHADIGMAQATLDTTVLGAGAGPFSSISGQVTNMHMSRPPDATMYSGAPFDFTRIWVALNAGTPGNGVLVYAQPTDEDGNFTIEGVPSGAYELVVFDSALDVIIASKVLNVTAPTALALGELPVFPWFTRQYHYVFEDTDQDGFRDADEVGIPEQAINLRFRDGSMYQSSATDGSGFVPFEEVFPFFNWLVAEVDYTRFKATGVTVVVDGGGNPNANTNWPAEVNVDADPRILSPQPQSENGGASYRTETGPVLLEAFQGFIGQTSVFNWGKAPFAPAASVVGDVNAAPFDVFNPGEPGSGDIDGNGNGTFDVDQFHGGVSGIVHYSITRAENDPRWGAAEPWEPGIPRVRVQLWDQTRTRLLNEVTTDSWDDSIPIGCQGEVFTYLGRATDCYDGLRNFNQVRPGVFDGGYAFFSVLEPQVNPLTGAPVPIEERTIERPLPAGRYVVKVVVPDGYRLVKEEDKNVDFGEEYIPQEFYLTGYPLGDGGASEPPPTVSVDAAPLAAPFCVGSLHEVPAELALFPGVASAYGGDQRPLCDAKVVDLRNGQNPGVNFFLFTEAPIAGHIVGFVLDDTANEFDPNSPQFGEKFAPPFLPIAVRDWTGREVARTMTDRYGVYNVLVPSTFTANAPIPSGMSPSMLTTCINSPMMPGPNGTMVPDPHFNKSYSNFCYTLQFMPGTTTYLDTPVLPSAAFAGPDQFPVDAELPTETPVIASVNGTALNIGPYVVAGTAAQRTIEIRSAGSVEVPNPAYGGVGGTQPKMITRDYGFGSSALSGEVRLGDIPLAVTSWSNASITAVVPATLRTGELTVTRCLVRSGAACTSSKRTVMGITLTVATPAMHTARPPHVVAAGQTIQSVIDSASTQPGDLVLVPPGHYQEMVVMSKPVRLQAWGSPVTTIDAVFAPAEKLQAWRDRVGSLLAANADYLVPDQVNILGAPPFADEILAAALGGEAAGVTVLGRNLPTGPLGECLTAANPLMPANEAFCLQNENAGTTGAAVLRANARIDGFQIIGSQQDAGVAVNGNARFLRIANNDIHNNSGNYGGGVRLGHPGAPLPLADEDARNGDVVIHNNVITQNAGNTTEGGGGIAIGTGAERYLVSENFVAANFTAGQGAGIAHIGLSSGGVIDRNTVIFNEGFNQAAVRSGGGIFVGGRPAVVGGITPGAGSVRISNNVVQGNQAGTGDGGGIALDGVNGADVQAFSAASGLRYRVSLFNNTIANNVAALAGGGVSVHDAHYVDIVHDTIVRNDSLATSGAAFTAGPTQSAPQPAGVVSRGHTPALVQALGAGEPAFSNPRIANAIVWQNRSYYVGLVTGGVQVPAAPAPAPTFGLIRNAAMPFWDLGVLGAAAGSTLNPIYSVLTSTAGYAASNIATEPTFLAAYFNGPRNPNIIAPELTIGIQTPAAFDEGGNFIRPIFGPLTLEHPAGPPFFGGRFGDYHLRTAGTIGLGLIPLFGGDATSVPSALATDIDAQQRPPATPHRGSDQVTGTIITPRLLVAALGFDETAGSVALDSSGTGNDGTINGPARVAGHFGGALQFDGVNDLVTVADANSLDLTRMTIMAWVRPTDLAGWRSVIGKERATTGNTYSLYASGDATVQNGNRVGPSSWVRVGSFDHGATSETPLSLDAWQHLAATYDGAVLRLYVDGVETESFSVTGSIAATNRALQIGGNTVPGFNEWFKGLIDEVLVYNYALSASEIQQVMTTALQQ